jgi:hypothetical protein
VVANFLAMEHRDMRSLTPEAQEERRRQVIGLRESGLTYEAIGLQVGLTRNGVFDICKRFQECGMVGLQTLMFVVNAFRRDGTTSAGRAKGYSGWLLRSAGGRAAETTVNRL